MLLYRSVYIGNDNLFLVIKGLWIHQACICPQVDHGPVYTWYAGKYQEYRVRRRCKGGIHACEREVGVNLK